MSYPSAVPPRKQINLDIPLELIQHLDRRAAERMCSRAALVRQLILADMEQQAAR